MFEIKAHDNYKYASHSEMLCKWRDIVMAIFWPVSADVSFLINQVQKKYHQHLEQALIASSFVDSKPFIKNKFNWGKVLKFSAVIKTWQDKKYDFGFILCSDAWHGLLNENQREAYVDLLLCRCQVEYEPATIVENKKKIVVKDEWGRVEFTNEMKYDDDGRPKWKVLPLDWEVLCENVKHYGLWCEALINLNYAIEKSKSLEAVEA